MTDDILERAHATLARTMPEAVRDADAPVETPKIRTAAMGLRAAFKFAWDSRRDAGRE